mgnify:CR=1 FL=1
MQFSLFLLDEEADWQFVLVSIMVAHVLVRSASSQTVLAHVGRWGQLGLVAQPYMPLNGTALAELDYLELGHNGLGGTILCGWGTHGTHLERSAALRTLLAPFPLRAFTLTKQRYCPRDCSEDLAEAVTLCRQILDAIAAATAAGPRELAP